MVVQPEVRRRNHGDSGHAETGRVLGERHRVGGRLGSTVHRDLKRPAAASTKSSATRRRSATESRMPSPVVPRASSPSSPAPARKSTSGANAASSSSRPPSRSGVAAAASVPEISTDDPSYLDSVSGAPLAKTASVRRAGQYSNTAKRRTRRRLPPAASGSAEGGFAARKSSRPGATSDRLPRSAGSP